DFIVCAGYKYLLSPWGTGFLWARPESSDSLRPGPYNWVSQGVESFARLNYVDPEPAPTLSRWDSSEAASIYNFNLTVMEASAKFVLDASPALIRDHNQALIDYFFERLPEGYRLASPRQALQRGVFGCIEVGSRGDTESLYQTLRDERFVVALREGKIPHNAGVEGSSPSLSTNRISVIPTDAKSACSNEAQGLDPYPAVVEATVQRARPVILTALAAVLAFIPLTTSVFWGSMACTLIGGTAAG